MSHPDWDRRFRLCHRRNLRSADLWSPDFWSPDLRSRPMAPSSLLLEKNDTSKNEVQNSRRWAFSYCWSLQDIEALSKRLQTRGPCTHRLQQPPSIHGHEEFELQTSPLGSRTLLLPLSNWLPSGQGKRSYKYVVLFPSEKPSRRRQIINWKHLNSL